MSASKLSASPVSGHLETEDARTSCNVPTESNNSVSVASHLVFDSISRLYSVLWQMSRPEIRAAFIGGSFSVPHNTHETLSSIDSIRDLVLPYPREDQDTASANFSTVVSQFLMDFSTAEMKELLGRDGKVLSPR